MQKTNGHPFPPLHQQRVVCVSVVYRSQQVLRVRSLETPEADEAAIIRNFFSGIERAAPRPARWMVEIQSGRRSSSASYTRASASRSSTATCGRLRV